MAHIALAARSLAKASALLAVEPYSMYHCISFDPIEQLKTSKVDLFVGEDAVPESILVATGPVGFGSAH